MRGSEVSISVVKCSWVKCGEVWWSVVKCNEVLQCSDGTSNNVSNIIKRHIDNWKLLLVHVFCYYHILSYSLGSFFIKYGCNLCIFIGRGYVLLLLCMYSYCCLCILIVVYVFLLLSIHSCCLCIVIFVYVFLLLSMYSYCCLCILIVVYVLSMYS